MPSGDLRSEGGAHLANFFGYLLPLRLFRAQQLFDCFLLRAQVFVFLADLHLLKPAQIAQPHIEDGVGLDVGELERLHQDRLRLILAADDFDDLVEIQISDQVAAQDFEPMLDLRQPMPRAAQQNVAAVREPLAQRLGQAEHLGNAAIDQHVHVERYAAFELGELEQALHQQRWIDRARARLEHDAHVFGQLVAHVGKERQFLLVDQLGDALDQAHLLHLPGNFRDHDLIGAAAGILGGPARAHAKRAAPGMVGFRDGLGRIDDDTASWKIRTRHVFEQRLGARIRLIDQVQRRVAQLGHVVRRDRRRHAHRNALRAVGEQIGNRSRQHHRLFLAAIVGRAEIDGILVDAIDEEPRHFGQPRFGVAHGGRIIAVDIAEIALAVDQRIA